MCIMEDTCFGTIFYEKREDHPIQRDTGKIVVGPVERIDQPPEWPAGTNTAGLLALDLMLRKGAKQLTDHDALGLEVSLRAVVGDQALGMYPIVLQEPAAEDRAGAKRRADSRRKTALDGLIEARGQPRVVQANSFTRSGSRASRS
jgi:hypothetical protein